jgi:tetratricopeptide (TPR) repeat protein
MKKETLRVFYLLIAVTAHSFAQEEVDSLKKVLAAAKHDTSRCSVLTQLVEAAPEGEWQKYNDQLVELSGRNLSSEKNSKLRDKYTGYLATGVNNMGYAAKDSGNYAAALGAFNESYSLYSKVYDHRGMADAVDNIGFVFQTIGKIDSAVIFYNQGLAIREKSGDKKGMAYSLNNIASVNFLQGRVEEAISCYNRTLQIFEQLKDKKGIALELNNLAYIYQNQEDYLTAEKYFLGSLAIKKEIGDQLGMVTTLANLGSLKIKTGNEKSAAAFLKEALKLAEDENYKKEVANIQNSLGYVLKKQGSYKEALALFEKAMKFYVEAGSPSGITMSDANISAVYLKMKEYGKAEKAGLSGLALAQKLNFKENIRMLSEVLYNVYKAENKFAAAIEMYELNISTRDSLNNERTRKAAVKQQLKYEYEKKSAADSVRNAELQKVKDAQLAAQNASLKQEKTQRYALYGGLLLIAGFLVFVFNRFRVTSKQKKVIEEQKLLVDHAYEKLHEKNKEVMDSIHYARRIQKALITSERYIERNLRRVMK